MGSSQSQLFFGILAVLTTALACGGSDDAAGGSASGLACTSEECRGDVTGTWTIAGVCIDKFTIEDDRQGCPEWKCRVVAADAQGTLAFEAGGAADVKFSTSLTSECTIPKSCLADAGHDSCEAYAASPGQQQKTCTDSGDVCQCTESADESSDIVGTWAIENETFFSIQTPTGMSGGNDWCVKTGELRMSWLRGANSASPNVRAVLIAR